MGGVREGCGRGVGGVWEGVLECDSDSPAA